MKDIETPITSLEKLNNDYLMLGIANLWNEPILAGQFAELTVTGSFLRKPFSIFNADDKEVFFLVKILGCASNKLTTYNVGDTLSALMPLGNSFDMSKASNPLLIGGGCGIAPLYLLAKQFKAQGISTNIIWGEKEGKTIPHKVVQQLQAVSSVEIFSEDGSVGRQGLVTEGLATKHDFIFSCGPKPMLKAIYEQSDVPIEVSLEEYMACGIGVCMGCVVELKDGSYQRVCKDGPVFKGNQLW